MHISIDGIVFIVCGAWATGAGLALASSDQTNRWTATLLGCVVAITIVLYVFGIGA